MTRARRRRHHVPEQDPRLLLAGVAVVAIAIAILVVALRSGGGLPGRDYYRLDLRFPSAARGTVLPPPGSDVRIAGRRVGQTRAAELRDGAPTLRLQLDGSTPRLPADTRFAVRAQGLLGAKYVDVVPGDSPNRVPDGGVVSARQSSVEVAVSDVLGAMDDPTRAGLERTIRGLGGGLAGRAGRLNEALDGVARPLERFSVAIAPVVRDGRAPEVVRAGARLLTSLERVRGELAAALDPGERSMRAFAEADDDVAALLRDGGRQVDGIRGSLVAVDPVLRRAERFAGAARRFAGVAPAALRETDRLLRGSDRPLRAAVPVLRDARSAVDPTVHLLRTAGPLLPRIGNVARTARQPSIDLGAYGCDLGRYARRWRSMLGWYPAGQIGPQGPLTMLRVSIASAGLPSYPSITPGSSYDGNIRPCETKVAP